MPDQNPFHSFEAQMARVKFIAQARTQCQLADILGVRQASISEASKRGRIPASWLVVLVQKFRANPDWILEGAMPVFLLTDETGREEGQAGGHADEVLRQMPLELLQEEISRRLKKAL